LRAAAHADAIAFLSFEALTPTAAQASFAALAHGRPGRIGVRLDADSSLDGWPESLIDAIDVVVLASGSLDATGDLVRRLQAAPRMILIECTGVEGARIASDLRADGLIAKGHEAPGLVGEETTFVLLQRLLNVSRLPVWAHGGIGSHTVAACHVAGCAGVVLDGQLALARESTLPDAVKAAIGRMAGDETVCLGCELEDRYRVYSRPDLRAPEQLHAIASDLSARVEDAE